MSKQKKDKTGETEMLIAISSLRMYAGIMYIHT